MAPSGSGDSERRAAPNRLRRTLVALVGLIIGATCLWLSTRGVDWREAVAIFRAADLRMVAIAMVLYGIAMVMRAWRWRFIVFFRSPVGIGTTLNALLTGYAVNNILPARLGEFFRADYLARRANLSRSNVLATIVVERLFDLLAAICLLAIGILLAKGQRMYDVLAVAALVAAAGACTMLWVAARLSRDDPAGAISRLLSWLPGGAAIARYVGPRLYDFAQSLRILQSTRLWVVAAVTVPIWAVEAMAVWSICRAADVDLALGGMMSLMGASALSTLLPTAPGYVGSYQLAYVITLAGYGFDATAAVVAATTVQIYLMGGFTLLGLAILALTRVRGGSRNG